MGEVSNVSTTVSRKKKSAALIEPKRQAASGKVRLNVKLNGHNLKVIDILSKNCAQIDIVKKLQKEINAF